MFANLAAMHRATAERFPAKTSLRYKRDGAYRDFAWSEYRRQADCAAAALIELGTQPGDRVGLLSENRYEWLVADIGILSAGAADVPMHAPLSPAQVEYQLAHSEARGVIVGSPAQADKVFARLDSLPALEFLIAFDPLPQDRVADLRGKPTPAGSLRILSWQELLAQGAALSGQRKEISRRESLLGHDDLATIIYTSGTTGNPKGVMLTHGNLCSNAEAMLSVADTTPDDVLLSWLPYSHVYARTVDHYLDVLVGSTVCLAESQETLLANLAEIQPTWITAVPRFYEKVWSAVCQLPADVRAVQIKKIFGPRIRWLSSGGAPLPRHVAEGFIAAGILLLEGYGLTESSPVISFNRLDNYRVGTVGQSIPGVEVRIANDGEILTRGPHVMRGYWKEPDATAAAIVDGWLHTGDVGHLDAEGFLTITDRKKDLIITSGGKNIAPSELERLLVGDPYIDQAVVCGDRRPFVAALVVPNFQLLKEKAAELGRSLDVTDGLIQDEAILAFMAARIESVMQVLSQPERVKKFLLLGRPFQAESNELTATLKVRRRHILEKYAARIDALYADCAERQGDAGPT